MIQTILKLVLGMLLTIQTVYGSILTVPSPYTNIQHALNFASVYVQNDYDSVSRPQGSGWSIGAYEYITGSDPDPDPDPDPPVVLPNKIFTGKLRIVFP